MGIIRWMSDHHRHHPTHHSSRAGWYTKHVKFNRRRRFQFWLGIALLVVFVGWLLNGIIFGDLAGVPVKYEAEINAAADEFKIDRAVMFGLVRAESTFNPSARSRAGAIGLCQLMPTTAAGVAKRLGIEGFTTAMLYDPAINARLGAAYLRGLLDTYNQDIKLALMGYNGGPGAANRYLSGGMLPRETSRYYGKVLQYADSYAELFGTPGYTASTSATTVKVTQPVQAGKDIEIIIPNTNTSTETGLKGVLQRWFGR